MPGADSLEPIVSLTAAPTAEEEHAVGSGLARFNEQQSGISDSRPLAVIVRDPQTKQPVGGLTGRTSRGLLSILRRSLVNGGHLETSLGRKFCWKLSKEPLTARHGPQAATRGCLQETRLGSAAP